VPIGTFFLFFAGCCTEYGLFKQGDINE